jgi:hypothetical protein
VSTWRCKCGITIKVTGETIRNKAVTPQMAKCPNCGFQQTVDVDRILTITDDTANTITRKRAKP